MLFNKVLFDIFVGFRKLNPTYEATKPINTEFINDNYGLRCIHLSSASASA